MNTFVDPYLPPYTLGEVNWTEYAPFGDREHAVFSVAADGRYLGHH